MLIEGIIWWFNGMLRVCEPLNPHVDVVPSFLECVDQTLPQLVFWDSLMVSHSRRDDLMEWFGSVWFFKTSNYIDTPAHRCKDMDMGLFYYWNTHAASTENWKRTQKTSDMLHGHVAIMPGRIHRYSARHIVQCSSCGIIISFRWASRILLRKKTMFFSGESGIYGKSQPTSGQPKHQMGIKLLALHELPNSHRNLYGICGKHTDTLVMFSGILWKLPWFSQISTFLGWVNPDYWASYPRIDKIVIKYDQVLISPEIDYVTFKIWGKKLGLRFVPQYIF